MKNNAASGLTRSARFHIAAKCGRPFMTFPDQQK